LSFETIDVGCMSEKFKPFLIRPGVDTGSSRDWDELREGYQLVEHYRQSLRCAERSPMYYATGYDEDGSPRGIRENLGPWEAVDEAAEELSNNQAAVRILKAHKFTVEQISTEGGVAIRNAEGNVVTSGEMPIFIKRQENKVYR
jgi:hypothetical protein